MQGELPDFLALVNDILQAAIVVFGVAVTLYNVGHSLRDRVTRAFNALLLFVTVVYFSELLVTRATTVRPAETWMRLGWIGISMIPAAQFHLADALLVTTGDIDRTRRLLVRFWYLAGVVFFALAIFTDSVVADLVRVVRAPHMSAGSVFPVFATYYWLISAVGVYLVWRARARCLTKTTRRRVSVILVAFLAAPLSVFPYTLVSGNASLDASVPFWLVLILGNVVVSLMFALLTYYIAYFGAISPDRVVRVRLFKFMARVPLAATLVLLVYVIVLRVGPILGLPVETALAISVVAAVLLVEWGIYALKRQLERLFQLTDEPEVRRIQQLSERVLTTRDMRQFLESVLAATCELLRTPTSFVAALTPDGPRLEAVVGPLTESGQPWPGDGDWPLLAEPSGNGEQLSASLATADGFVLWRDYWIRPIHAQQDERLLGILGVRSRAPLPDLTESEQETFEHLVNQASRALEDRLLQQDVFAAVEGLLPQITEIQMRRSAATFGGAPALTAPQPDQALLADPNFNSIVRDALSHYWGGPKLSQSPLVRLSVVQRAMRDHGGNPTKALREILSKAIEQQRPEGERNMTKAEWILYNILELKFVQGQRVRDVARRLAMSESDLYRKQRIAIESVAHSLSHMEESLHLEPVEGQPLEESSA